MNPAPGPSTLEMLLPFFFILVIFYFLIIRPQSKKLKEQQSFVDGLKRGEDVITQAGILGKIEGLNDTVATLDVGSGMRLKVLRRQIVAYQSSLEPKTNDTAQGKK